MNSSLNSVPSLSLGGGVEGGVMGTPVGGGGVVEVRFPPLFFLDEEEEEEEVEMVVGVEMIEEEEEEEGGITPASRNSLAGSSRSHGMARGKDSKVFSLMNC